MNGYDPLAIAANAARGFPVFECRACANSIRKALVEAGHRGQTIEIRAMARDFMICFSYEEGNTSITETGVHVGVRVGDMMFDNLHPEGLSYAEWLDDFDGVGGVRVRSVVDF